MDWIIFDNKKKVAYLMTHEKGTLQSNVAVIAISIEQSITFKSFCIFFCRGPEIDDWKVISKLIMLFSDVSYM